MAWKAIAGRRERFWLGFAGFFVGGGLMVFKGVVFVL